MGLYFEHLYVSVNLWGSRDGLPGKHEPVYLTGKRYELSVTSLSACSRLLGAHTQSPVVLLFDQPVMFSPCVSVLQSQCAVLVHTLLTVCLHSLQLFYLQHVCQLSREPALTACCAAQGECVDKSEIRWLVGTTSAGPFQPSNDTCVRRTSNLETSCVNDTVFDANRYLPSDLRINNAYVSTSTALELTNANSSLSWPPPTPTWDSTTGICSNAFAGVSQYLSC